MRSRIGFRLLGLAVALVLSILAVLPSEAAGCFNNKLVIYYSDASHTTEVGRCEPTCCDGCHCTGTTSQFTVVYAFNCLGVCPPKS